MTCRRTSLAGLLAGLLLLTTTGCGGSDHRLTGKVTFKGQPIPKGFILFEPDTGKGNSGRGGGASIVNGTYATSSGKGLANAGTYVVKITGYDGIPTTSSGEELPDGKSLFSTYTTTVDFSPGITTQDFDVPLSATAPPKQPPTTTPRDVD